MKPIKIYLLLPVILLISSCESKITEYPVAMFDLETPPRYLFKTILDASGSFSTQPGDYLEYRWDLNGDHLEWETDWLYNPRLVYQVEADYISHVGLQVRDSKGNITEIYQEVWCNTDYRISTAYLGLDPVPRRIDYRSYEETYYYTWSWTYDNIQAASSEEVYNFSSANDRALYGSLMTWNVADTLDDNFHLPTRDDWEKMFDFCGGYEFAGFNLQVAAEHGLNLTLAGTTINGWSEETGVNGYYWTGDEYDESSAYAVKITSGSDAVEFVVLDKSTQASVRLMYEYYQYFN